MSHILWESTKPQHLSAKDALTCTLFGRYQGSGSLEAARIQAVIPAMRADGHEHGTQTLKSSNDFFNPSWTFSVVYLDNAVPCVPCCPARWSRAHSDTEDIEAQHAKDKGEHARGQKYLIQILDIECDDSATYSQLFKGFSSLRQASADHFVEEEEAGEGKSKEDSNVDDLAHLHVDVSEDSPSNLFKVLCRCRGQGRGSL
jgi:hypothetical protein